MTIVKIWKAVIDLADIQKFKTTVAKRGSYGFGITLDKRICQKFGIQVGDQVEQFEHPTRKGVICIAKVKIKLPPW